MCAAAVLYGCAGCVCVLYKSKYAISPLYVEYTFDAAVSVGTTSKTSQRIVGHYLCTVCSPMNRASFALKLMIKLSRIHRFCDCCHQETVLIVYASHEAFGNANGCSSVREPSDGAHHRHRVSDAKLRCAPMRCTLQYEVDRMLPRHRASA